MDPVSPIRTGVHNIGIYCQDDAEYVWVSGKDLYSLGGMFVGVGGTKKIRFKVKGLSKEVARWLNVVISGEEITRANDMIMSLKYCPEKATGFLRMFQENEGSMFRLILYAWHHEVPELDDALVSMMDFDRLAEWADEIPERLQKRIALALGEVEV